MKKISMISLVIVVLLCFSLSVSVAHGTYHVGVTWGSQYGQEVAERAEHSAVCSDVRGYFDGTSGWVANNLYGPSTYDSNVYQCSDSVRGNANYDYLATFHVGHMYPNYVEYGHYEIIGYDQYGRPIIQWFVDGSVRHYAYYGSQGAYNGIEDLYLHSHTGAKHYFTMIWTCTNADLFENPYNQQLCYGYYESTHGTGVVGMPYAWTQTTSLDQSGYDNNPVESNFCYIGFENVSKPLTEDFESSGTNNYGDFIRRFYYHALNGNSIIDALDYATDDMDVGMAAFDAEGNDLYYGWNEYVEGFEDPWFCRMRVYGDGDNVLGVVG